MNFFKTDAQKKFVDILREYLEFDALTSQWLNPLEPLLNMSYRYRFRISLEGILYFLVFNDSFDNGHSWLTPKQFYDYSRTRVEELLRYDYCDFYDLPTGYTVIHDVPIGYTVIPKSNKN